MHSFSLYEDIMRWCSAPFCRNFFKRIMNGYMFFPLVYFVETAYSLIGLSKVIITFPPFRKSPSRNEQQKDIMYCFLRNAFSLLAFMTAHRCCLSNYPEQIESSCSCHKLHCIVVSPLVLSSSYNPPHSLSF